MVSRFIHNPILKGVRVRNKKMSKRINLTGRRKSSNAPASKRLERHCPHLAFIETARYDRLIAQLDQRNAIYRRTGVNGVDTRRNVPKKRTVWPGQHIDCGVCGRPFVYGGHGQNDHLMCRGAHEYLCWNGITVDGPLGATKMIAAIRAAIAGLPDFDPVLLEMVRDEWNHQQGGMDQRQQDLARRAATVERETQNVMAAVRQAGPSSILMEELARLEEARKQHAWDRQELARIAAVPPVFPSMVALKQSADQAFDTLAVTSQEFGRLLRGLIPRIMVFPFRLCDGGHPVLRARFTLRLTSLLPESSHRDRVAGTLERFLEVDLTNPPQREEYRERVCELTAAGTMTQRQIAAELGIDQPTVQRALALDRLLAKLGRTDPYVPLIEPPEDYARMRRHHHPRYRYTPLPGFPTEHAAPTA